MSSSLYPPGAADSPVPSIIVVVCLAGCQFLVLAITTGKKKVPVICLAGCRLRPEKKKKASLQLSVWLNIKK